MAPRRKKTRLRRVLLRWFRLLSMALLLLGVVGAVGYHFFTGWRARDLAAKAKANFEKANYRMAWLQINSAKELRDNDPSVLRVLGLIEGAMGRASALERYEELSAGSALTPEDLRAWAEAAVRHGDDSQFATAVEALEKSGQTTEAGALRAARKLRQGDLDRAITEARAAAAVSDDPASRLTLARMLVLRYRPEFNPSLDPSAEALAASNEISQIIDGLLATPQREDALAFALTEAGATPSSRQRWAVAAMENLDVGNRALLPAASVLVQAGQKTPQQIHEQLRPLFDAAPLERRADYALWLTVAGMPKEALTLVTAQEAGQSTAAFGARTEALFALENFDALLAAVEAGGSVDPDVLFAAKARAEYARGRGAQGGATALREALGAAVRSRRLELIVPSGDALGASGVVDETLAELCGDAAEADYVFRVARDRFSRSGRASLLAASFQRAQSASPQSPAVKDYVRYLALNANEQVSLDDTAAACESEPSNVTFRITHALNLLRNKQPAEALKIFDDITVFADRLPPGQLAVIAAVFAANGDAVRARAAAALVRPDQLTPAEYALVLPLRAAVE